MAAAEDVEVEVGNGFAAVGPVVDDDAEAVTVEAFLLGDGAEAGHHVAEEFLVFGGGFGDAGDGLFWDKEEVGGGLGTDVAETEAEVVLVDDVGGDLAIGDFLEEGFHPLRGRW